MKHVPSQVVTWTAALGRLPWALGLEALAAMRRRGLEPTAVTHTTAIAGVGAAFPAWISRRATPFTAFPYPNSRRLVS